MEIITSSKNGKIKNITALLKSKKERDEQGVFVIEGLRIYKDTLNTAPQYLESVFVSESFIKEKDNRGEALLTGTSDIKDITVVKDSVFDSISQTVTPQGVMCIVRKPEYSLSEDGVFISENGVMIDNGKGQRKLLVLENIQDPGNLGTMLRTAEAAGMSGIIMNRGCADIYNPKIIRSTMGSIFRVPFIYSDDLLGTINKLQNNEINVFAAYLHGGIPYTEADYGKNYALMIGNEGNGLTEEAAAIADKRIYIPMSGQIESLNAAIAAAILMFKQ